MSKLKSGFKFLPDIATADLALEAYGKDYNELFENAGLALESAMVDLKTIEESRVQKITLKGDNLESLLFSFLEELIFLKDSKLLLFNRFVCYVGKTERGKWKLEAKAVGEVVNRQKHNLRVDVKAATKHLFKVEKLPDKTYYCRVVLDV